MKKFLLLVTALCTLGMAAETLTVFEGTDANNRVPLDSYWWDSSSPFFTQVIYPANALAEMEGATITGIKFYLNADGVKFKNGLFDLQLGVTEQTTFNGAITEGLTDVLTNQTAPETGLTEVEFTFTTPFVFEGGNLLYSCHLTEAGSFSSSFFYGVNQQTNTAWARNEGAKFIPKTTFIYTPAAPQEYKAIVTPSQLDFGKINPGQSAVLNVTVKNKGLNAFTPTVSLSGPFNTTYEAAELAAGAEVEIPVTFAPTALGVYSCIMAVDCGEAGEFNVELNGKAVVEQELTVCDGTATNGYVPIYGLYTDNVGTFSQMIYPATMLEGLEGATITGIKFYPTDLLQLGSPTIELSMTETDQTVFERETATATPDNLITDLTTVGSVTLATGYDELAFEFTTPFVYQGGNLALNTLVTAKGGWKTTYFYGENVASDDPNIISCSYCQWTSNKAMVPFLPKMTITYTPAQTEPEEPVYYVVGGFNAWSQEEGMVEITEAGATITVEAQDLNNSEDESQEFKIITADVADGEGWIWLGGADDNQVGYFEITEELLGGQISFDTPGANFRLPSAGTYTIKIVQDAGKAHVEGIKMVVTKETVTAIENIKGEVKGDNNYYNLMGQKMNGNNLPAGIYIHNGKKIIVR